MGSEFVFFPSFLRDFGFGLGAFMGWSSFSGLIVRRNYVRNNENRIG
jgi:hypothetical protein